MENGIYESIEAWTVNIPPGEVISSTSKASFKENVYSATRILGDRTSLEKYLNKNLLAVATVKNATKPADSAVNLYLIDSITGNIVFQTYHLQCYGPVSIAMAANSVIYHYFNAKSHMFEISVVELYEKNLNWDE